MFAKEKKMTAILFFKILIQNKFFTLLKYAMGWNQIKVNKDICKYEKTVITGFSNIDEDMR